MTAETEGDEEEVPLTSASDLRQLQAGRNSRATREGPRTLLGGRVPSASASCRSSCCVCALRASRVLEETQNKTKQNKTKQNKTKQNKTKQNTTQHNTTQHNTTQHNTTQHNTTQHNTTQQNKTKQNKTNFCSARWLEPKWNCSRAVCVKWLQRVLSAQDE